MKRSPPVVAEDAGAAKAAKAESSTASTAGGAATDPAVSQSVTEDLSRHAHSSPTVGSPDQSAAALSASATPEQLQQLMSSPGLESLQGAVNALNSTWSATGQMPSSLPSPSAAASKLAVSPDELAERHSIRKNPRREAPGKTF